MRFAKTNGGRTETWLLLKSLNNNDVKVEIIESNLIELTVVSKTLDVAGDDCLLK